MGVDIAICGTAGGDLATPAEAIGYVLDARRLTHLDLGVGWLVGVVADGERTTLVADLPRLLDTTLPGLTGQDRAAYSEIVLLASPERLGVAVTGYRMARNCRVQHAGRSLRGLRHILGLVSLPDSAALPLLWIGGAFGVEQRACLAEAIAALPRVADCNSVDLHHTLSGGHTA